jgi:hypothetical protein
VTDPPGNIISRIRAVGNGFAESPELKKNYALAGQRAASDLSAKLKQVIILDERLK